MLNDPLTASPSLIFFEELQTFAEKSKKEPRYQSFLQHTAKLEDTAILSRLRLDATLESEGGKLIMLVSQIRNFVKKIFVNVSLEKEEVKKLSLIEAACSLCLSRFQQAEVLTSPSLSFLSDPLNSIYSYLMQRNTIKTCEELERFLSEPIYGNTIRFLLNADYLKLKSQHLQHFIECLHALFPKKFEFIPNALVRSDIIEGRKPDELTTLHFQEKTGKEKAPLFFIPFVFPGHIVVITVSFKDKTIEYYDPKGHRPEDWYCYSDFSMKASLEMIGKNLFPEESEVKFLINNKKQQTDSHSCGILIANYIFLRVFGLEFKEISTLEFSNGDLWAIRQKMAFVMAGTFSQKTTAAKNLFIEEEVIQEPCECEDMSDELFLKFLEEFEKDFATTSDKPDEVDLKK
ncbi:Ulp1 family isopeptidase [Criblamydia sequanensis]|uniref:Ubiquitin-like protease family profile domain-containing protein n=1 Tax=Candidatus Criblamydia sequanensis CRIB-18 TaxID=1437425 RepID=A0A090D2V5_9BACT|nr:Ulp1 family isopeptidase [Criblamydia sequanensis]CDR34980.1 hypothetical protein CSEC_2174 [Criblamydia sequanensis CRIB-18]